MVSSDDIEQLGIGHIIVLTETDIPETSCHRSIREDCKDFGRRFEYIVVNTQTERIELEASSDFLDISAEYDFRLVDEGDFVADFFDRSHIVG